VRMKTSVMLLAAIVVTVGMLAITRKRSPVVFAKQGSLQSASSQRRLLRGYGEIDPIDSHTHVYRDDAAFSAFLKRLNLHIVDICVIDDRDPFFKALQPQLRDVLDLVRSSGGFASLCTTFSPYSFEEPGFAERSIHQLNRNFSEGAVAVKIYKTIGMEIRTKSGKYLMPDNPVFESIYKDISAHNRTVIAHIAEPASCWQPPNPASPDYQYYKEHPQEYAYLHAGWPSQAAILAARDHMLAENPKLRVVGAHLGSIELDVNEIAKRFDLYPNFGVDTAARVPYLMLQPREKVRAFPIKYQDRVLYGTDLAIMPQENTVAALRDWESTYARDWAYFATDETLEYRGRKIQGLELPKGVLPKLYHDNAVRWFPGILKPAQ
jgi:predicted TIM-barrel fold metal-dependent hydrolase